MYLRKYVKPQYNIKHLPQLRTIWKLELFFNEQNEQSWIAIDNDRNKNRRVTDDKR